MIREEIEAILSEWVKAWTCRDARALAASCSEDALYVSMLAGTIQGRQAIESLYGDWFSAFPEMVFQVENTVIDGDRVALFWSQKGRHMGEFCGVAATGRSFHLHGVFLMAFKSGEIAHMQSIYDFTGLLLQVGALKAKPAS